MSGRSEITVNVMSCWWPYRELDRKWRHLTMVGIFLQIYLTFILSSIFHRRIQSQHNLLEKELAEHTIDFLKSSNIRIIEKVSKIIELEKIAVHNAAGPIKAG